MYSVSDKFLQHINRSGHRKTVVDVYYYKSLLLEDVPVVSGQITYDRKARVKSHGQVQLVSKRIDWTALDPFGTYLVIKTGVVYPNGDEELVPLGKFLIQNYEYIEGSPVAPTVNFFDFAKQLEDVFTWDSDFSGQMAQTCIQNHINFCMPLYTSEITLDYQIDNYKLPGGFISTGDDLDAVERIAAAKGGEVYFDRDGDMVVKKFPVVSASTTISDTVYDISVGINLIEANRVRSREEAFNGVYVSGGNNSSGVQVSGYAYDDTPGSPLRQSGPFGRKIKVVNLPTLTTSAAALQAAKDELKASLGLSQSTRFTALLNPALEIGDFITLFYFNGEVEIHSIESIQYDLKSWQMECTTRTTQFVE